MEKDKARDFWSLKIRTFMKETGIKMTSKALGK
jgi:hypothetical protein